MATTLAEVLHRFGPEYLSHHMLSSPQARAWRAPFLAGGNSP